jgi:hypothetical protein
MPKPRLPRELELFFPSEVLHLIYGYVPPKPPTPAPSPGLQRELERLQYGTKHTAMYLKGLDDFVLK